MVYFKGFRHKKYEILQPTFIGLFFFIKTKKMIFLEVEVTIIGENASKCLQCINMIIHKERHT